MFAQAVLIDLCTRRMVDHLFRGLTATFARESSSQHHSFQPDEWSEADRASIRRWIQWIVDVLQFMRSVLLLLFSFLITS